MSSERGTIIIPAHNEEQVIAQTLQNLAELDLSVYTALVVCNGCTDKTAEVARRTLPDASVIEIEEAGKILAIEAAEALKPAYPVVYMDADISMTSSEIENLVQQAINYDGLITPEPEMDLAQTSWLVRRFYEEWLSTDFVRVLGFGAGVYVLSEAARKKFRDWPDIINDDGYLRYVFGPDEIKVSAAKSRVRAPRSLVDLLRIKIRSRYGNRQLREKFGDPPYSLRYQPGSLIGAIVYYSVNLATLAGALWQQHVTGFIWYRDR